MKNVIILFFLCLINYVAFGQRNFYKLNVGLGVGITRAYTEYNTAKGGRAQNILADYYFTPYSSFGVEVQKGILKGKELVNSGFENDYLAVFGNGKVHLGEILPFSYHQNRLEKLLKGVYFGAGLGAIKNKVSRYDDSATPRSVLLISKEVLVPLNVGIDIYLTDPNAEQRFAINVNAQTAVSLDDNLDGQFTPSNTKTDRYHFFAIGLRYNFGFKGYYRKGSSR